MYIRVQYPMLLFAMHRRKNTSLANLADVAVLKNPNAKAMLAYSSSVLSSISQKLTAVAVLIASRPICCKRATSPPRFALFSQSFD